MNKLKSFKLILLTLFFFKIMLTALFSMNDASIIVKINNEIITSHDLKVETKYLEALNPNLKNLTKDQKEKVAKESIIREKIKEGSCIRIDYLNDSIKIFLNEKK